MNIQILDETYAPHDARMPDITQLSAAKLPGDALDPGFSLSNKILVGTTRIAKYMFKTSDNTYEKLWNRTVFGEMDFTSQKFMLSNGTIILDDPFTMLTYSSELALNSTYKSTGTMTLMAVNDDHMVYQHHNQDLLDVYGMKVKSLFKLPKTGVLKWGSLTVCFIPHSRNIVVVEGGNQKLEIYSPRGKSLSLIWGPTVSVQLSKSHLNLICPYFCCIGIDHE